jgi:hypothetical protein
METGKEIWVFDPFPSAGVARRTLQNRGVAYWEGISPVACAANRMDKRIFYATFDGRLFALDRQTGLSVDPAPDLPTETDDEAIQTAITRSRFLVRFDEGTLIDGRHKSDFGPRHLPHQGKVLTTLAVRRARLPRCFRTITGVTAEW